MGIWGRVPRLAGSAAAPARVLTTTFGPAQGGTRGWSKFCFFEWEAAAMRIGLCVVLWWWFLGWLCSARS